MSASKDKKRGTWKIYVRYTDWKGDTVVHTKRGFATKKEALEYERSFLLQKSSDLNMAFEKFFDRYKEDKKARVKENTWESKEHIVRTKILPYFGKTLEKKVADAKKMPLKEQLELYALQRMKKNLEWVVDHIPDGKVKNWLEDILLGRDVKIPEISRNRAKDRGIAM